jgi:Integrase zinc binding domain
MMAYRSMIAGNRSLPACCHTLVAGHLGFNKAYERLRQGFTWPEMYSELKAYVRSCD